MNTSTEPFGLPDTAPELARRFAVLIAGLGALIARRFVKMPHLSGFTIQLWSYLNRAVRRFHRALTHQPPNPPRARLGRADHARVRPVAFPSGRGWLVRALGWEAAAYLVHLEALLAEVATRAALNDAPGAGRVLRPICRMLGASPAVTPDIAPKLLPASVPVVCENVCAPQAQGLALEPDPEIFLKGEG